jgi:hypothetical protein
MTDKIDSSQHILPGPSESPQNEPFVAAVPSNSEETPKKSIRVMICSYLHSFWLERYGIPREACGYGTNQGPFLKEFVKFTQRLRRGNMSKKDYYMFEQKRVARMIATVQMMQKHNIDIINLSAASKLIVTQLVENGWITDIRDGESAMDAIVSQPDLLSSKNLECDTSGVTSTPPNDRVGTCILLSPKFIENKKELKFIRHNDDEIADVGGFAGVFISSINSLFLTMKLESSRAGSQGSKEILDSFASKYRENLDKCKILAGGNLNLLWDTPRSFDKKNKSTLSDMPFKFERVGSKLPMPTFFGSGTIKHFDYWVGKGYCMKKCFLPKEIYCAWEFCNGDISVLLNKSLELFGSDHSWVAAEFDPLEENSSNQTVEYFLIDSEGSIEPLDNTRIL